ncbi:quinone oxidoreductase family protein [Streptomyces werraensis]|uniref:quinone oxidoreductase family protein n=1 Tax=Streptomyces werraensis TaxID=68284 RepID=UPI001CE2F77E
MIDELPEPAPTANEILVRVRAAALNRVDLGMSTGGAHGTNGGIGTTLGLEWAGEVVEVGEHVDRWRVGDRVMANGPGAFAEYAVTSASAVFSVPDALDWAQAAALPVGLQTMHDALVARGGFVSGQSVLIQGATSAMGIIGIQIARELGASVVIGTTTSEQKVARIRQFGADVALNSTRTAWVDRVLEVTDGTGVDVVLDLVAGELATDNLRATRIGGRIVNIGRVGGERVTFDLNLHSLRRITYVGTTFRTRTREEVAEVVREADKALGAAIAAGRVSIPVSATYPLAAAREALDAMANNTHLGKLVLLP